MILVDTSIWVEHLRAADPVLAALLTEGIVLCHPWVIGELALGHLAQRERVLGLLDQLPMAVEATPTEVRALIDERELFGLGIGYVDTQLLAATLLTDDTRLWTRDKRLAAAASRLGRGAAPSGPAGS